MINRQTEIDDILRTHSCFTEIVVEMTDNECLKFFNPIDEEQYNFYLDNWTNAILMGLNKIVDLEAP